MKAITLIISFLITFSLFSQKHFGTYESSQIYETFEILFSEGENNDFTLYIYGLSLDPLTDQIGLMVTSSYYDKFIESVSLAKEKYVEWVAVAKSNNVKDLSKAMKINLEADGMWLYSNNWQFDFSVDLTFIFTVKEKDSGIDYVLYISSGEMQSSSNEYITTDGCVLVFNSENEILQFLNSISKEKVDEFLSKPSTEDLFED